MNAPQIHPSAEIGPRVTISAGAFIGPNCRLDGETTIGARTRLLQGVTLTEDARIGADCVLGPGVSLAMPNARVSGPLELGAGVHIGAGSVLRPGVRIGAHVRIAAESVVSRNLPPHAIAAGNPAVAVGFETTVAADNAATRDAARKTATTVAGVGFYHFPRIDEPRGVLTVAEFGEHVPFKVNRYFLVYDVPSGETRGDHARSTCKELLVCVKGSVHVFVDDGSAREELVLDKPEVGLYIPERIWATQYKHSADAVLLVLASHHYDPTDYIGNYEDFLAARKSSA